MGRGGGGGVDGREGVITMVAPKRGHELLKKKPQSFTEVCFMSLNN